MKIMTPYNPPNAQFICTGQKSGTNRVLGRVISVRKYCQVSQKIVVVDCLSPFKIASLWVGYCQTCEVLLFKGLWLYEVRAHELGKSWTPQK
eukprot:6423160-Amphidinium_carterae.1